MADKLSTKKFEQLPNYEQILQIVKNYQPDLELGRISQKKLFTDYIVPLLPQDSSVKISYTDFSRLVRKQQQIRSAVVTATPQTLLDREVERRKQQIEIRQDATELMRKFISLLKELVQNEKNLSVMQGKTITTIYKIIREEEDRQKSLELRERAENRADANFAFMVSLNREGELYETDIEFLSDDIKAELQYFKGADGIYRLPTGNCPMGPNLTPKQAA